MKIVDLINQAKQLSNPFADTRMSRIEQWIGDVRVSVARVVVLMKPLVECLMIVLNGSPKQIQPLVDELRGLMKASRQGGFVTIMIRSDLVFGTPLEHHNEFVECEETGYCCYEIDDLADGLKVGQELEDIIGTTPKDGIWTFSCTISGYEHRSVNVPLD